MACLQASLTLAALMIITVTALTVSGVTIVGQQIVFWWVTGQHEERRQREVAYERVRLCLCSNYNLPMALTITIDPPEVDDTLQ